MHFDITDIHYRIKQEIVQALFQVVDPELGINIIDLGLVYGIAVEDTDKTVRIDMTLSTPSCPLGGLIKSHVTLAAETAAPGFTVVVNLVWEPRWNAERISGQGHALLGW
ncbi:metal-sulfur cluster assembly factor [Sediminibacterium soli]|uniref:metal-sulfur cluster assembly factor n=1 Tax=Sediminibacterium soli TaxID=2698829 RepID=UPI00137A5FE9|nr:metal-sulfur cluster assembly factor [Sediminibacterium soli]NCI46274.1 metal-sulfur cluster assembly factor [Sediminibacterium soli]